jgi:hypothetical protein
MMLLQVELWKVILEGESRKAFLNGSNAKRRRDMNRNRRKKLKTKFFTLSNAREERKARDGKVRWCLVHATESVILDSNPENCGSHGKKSCLVQRI